MSLLIKNIKGLVQVRSEAPEVVAGTAMGSLPILENAWILLDNGLIADYGTMDSCSVSADKTLDATGKFVLPTWCDSHTHIVYAANREGEFVDRIKGATYEEIAAKGGGILNSARRLQNTSEDDLFESAKVRLKEMMSLGSGAIEIKSGYGLTMDAELKMLRVIKRLKDLPWAPPIKANFLAAHAIPLEYKNDRDTYINLIINEMLPVVHEEQLADYIDVFCDRGFYTPEETDRILKAGEEYGLRAKIHANELDYSGGIQVGVANNALSVDHLEFTGEEEIALLKASKTMPTLLPSTAFFLQLHYPPARKMIDAGLPVALATDYNPGSSPSGNMSFVLSLACIYLKMTPAEAINAATINSAYAMDMSHNSGTITKGKRGSVLVTKPMSSIDMLPYAFGSQLVEEVIIDGKRLN